jgi:hypothetical protein
LSVISIAQTEQQAAQAVAIAVKDVSGAVVPGATVELVGKKGCFKATKAGADGRVSLELPPDQYELFVLDNGFWLMRRPVYVGDRPQEIVTALRPASCTSCVDFGSQPISIVAVDEHGNAIPKFRAWFQSAQNAFSLLSDAKGQIKKIMPVAQYDLVLARDGFVPHISKLLVSPGEELTLKVTLKHGEKCVEAK